MTSNYENIKNEFNGGDDLLLGNMDFIHGISRNPSDYAANLTNICNAQPEKGIPKEKSDSNDTQNNSQGSDNNSLTQTETKPNTPSKKKINLTDKTRSFIISCAQDFDKNIRINYNIDNQLHKLCIHKQLGYSFKTFSEFFSKSMKDIYSDNSIKGTNETKHKKNIKKELENELDILFKKKPDLKILFNLKFVNIYHAYINEKTSFPLEDGKEIDLSNFFNDKEKGITLEEEKIIIPRINDNISINNTENGLIKEGNSPKKKTKFKIIKES
jgi:hypothetical protein